MHTDAGAAQPTRPALVDTSETSRTYLWTCANGVYLKLSPSAYHLLKCVEAGISFESIAQALSRRQGRVVTAEEIAAAHRSLREQIDTSEQRSMQMPADFWLRLPLIPAPAVVAVARRLTWLFQPRAAALLIALALLGHALALRGGLTLQYAQAEYWGGYALYLAAIIAHELGHAAACARYGARPDAIGFGVYWMFPVFYADVSSAWTLKRWQRVVVDVGGAYVQWLVCGGFAFAYLASGWAPLKVALTMSVLNSLFILNPILKFDGYWAVADSLGVTNLSQQPARIARHTLERLRRRPAAPLPWPTRIVLALALYSVATFGFWAYYSMRIVQFLLQQAVMLPAQARGLAETLAGGGQPSLAAAAGLLTSAVMVVLMTLLLWRLARGPLLSVARFVLRRVRPQAAAQAN